MVPAVVVLTRTFRERAMPRLETARGALTGSGRPSFRNSQSLNQLLHQAEQAEDQHRQHDVPQDTHHVSIRLRSPSGLVRAGSAWPSALRTRPKLDPDRGCETFVDTFFTPIGRTFTALRTA